MTRINIDCSKQSLLDTSLAIGIRLTWKIGILSTLSRVKQDEITTVPKIEARIWDPLGKLTEMGTMFL